jgi:hypothetical protein
VENLIQKIQLQAHLCQQVKNGVTNAKTGLVIRAYFNSLLALSAARHGDGDILMLIIEKGRKTLHTFSFGRFFSLLFIPGCLYLSCL